jgi:hypothetical protein
MPSLFKKITNQRKGKYFIKPKYRSFIEDSTAPNPDNQLTSLSTPERETIKHILIGSRKAVMGTIRILQQLGYADIGDWSPLLPSPNPGEVMSILIRSISVK